MGYDMFKCLDTLHYTLWLFDIVSPRFHAVDAYSSEQKYERVMSSAVLYLYWPVTGHWVE